MKQIIDWSDIENFTPGEFPAGVLEKMSPDFIYKLEFFRVQLACTVNPSPVKGGWIRTDGSVTSQHFIGSDGNMRLSSAGDVFVNCDPIHALLIAVRCGFGGIGIYFDKVLNDKPTLMLHLDTRSSASGNPIIWLQDKDGIRNTISPRPNLDVINLLAGAR
jgi:hypothetical protein